MAKILDTRFDHQSVEEKIYKLWEKSGYFNPDRLPFKKGTKSFSIIMPPPNANGSLHAGHGLTLTIEDIITRYKRMRGYRTLWLPGLDHAGFETQVVYEKKLEKEGRSRFEMSKEELYEEIMNFTMENKKNIETQIRKIGASCDWSREKFTLDPDIVQIVYKTFEKLFNDGLVYRDKKIINWCPKHQTSLSDLETIDVQKNDKFYYFRYGPFIIGTARPETKFGDKYVVMHPDDKRYKKFKNGEKFTAEWINGPITATVIKDRAVDMNFGTGVMTITPWHDPIDFEIAKRHNLEKEQIIGFDGRLLPIAGEFAGMKIAEAREKIVEKLKSKGLVVRIDENYTHTVKTCYKCGTPIEPQIREQWFVKMKPLAKAAIEAIQKDEIKYIPPYYKKISLHWLKNIIDWNISRQIAWGIRIPAWFCASCGEPKINPKVKARWFLVHHGETDWNKEEKLINQIDIPLNETGRAQAQAVAKKLKNQKIDLIISSPLKRAYETAKIISEITGAEIVIDKNLKERHCGEAEGLTQQKAKEKYGGEIHSYEDSIPNSEKYKEVEERGWKALMKHKKNHHHKNVVIVSHGTTLRMIKKRIKNWSPEEALSKPSIKNFEIFEIDLLDSPCKKCGSDLFEQDLDVFDTWFSSGQWPFATLLSTGAKKNKKTKDIKAKSDFDIFYPTDVMETAGEIIFFWVARMIMLSLYVTRKIPFRVVYLHGLVLDAQGRKMSKSRGNVINPLDLTSKYGTDAFRIGLVIGNTPGTSLALDENKIRGYRNFSTKIWNVARFILMNKQLNKNIMKNKKQIALTSADRKNLNKLKKIKKEIIKHMDNFEFHLAAEKIYHYFWHTFADKIIEAYKPRLNFSLHQKQKENEDNSSSKSKISSLKIKADAAAAYQTLETILLECLKMLHPFMPFITEEIYQKFRPGSLLMAEQW